MISNRWGPHSDNPVPRDLAIGIPLRYLPASIYWIHLLVIYALKFILSFLIPFGLALLANSLCSGQEAHTMHEIEV